MIRMDMDENTLQQSLDVYRAQLRHVEQQVTVVGETEELTSLVSDLKELIELTEGSLLSLKKSQLFKTLEEAESSTVPSSASSSSSASAAATSAATSAATTSAAATSASGGLPLPSTSTSTASTLDDEYALFQAALQVDLAGGDDSNTSQPSPVSAPSGADNSTPLPTRLSGSHHHSDSLSSSDSDNEDSGLSKGEKSVDEELCRLVGMKCCAPFSHDWGKLDYHNALVMSAVRVKHTDQILVKVMYTTPTHIAMQPCKFFLNGHCRFNEDKCKYSHGETVELAKLREFVEADHSAIGVDAKCLAQYTDGIWYPATVTEVKDDVVSVHFDDYGQDLDVDITQVLPSAPPADGSSCDSEAEDTQPSTSTGQGRAPGLDSEEEEEEEEELPVFLWKPPQTTVALGEWEAHTRGIGSKLMSRMGYVHGQGLGVAGQGKAEPVPIMLLPQGKSLDRIMELKEMAGDHDLFNAMKKLQKRQKQLEKKQERDSQKAANMAASSAGSANVFDFINTRLAGKKGDLNSLTKSASHTSGRGAAADNSKGVGETSRRHISEHELHKRSDKDINLQVFKTHEEIRNVEREMSKLRQQLARNENKDRQVARQVRARLEEQEDYLRSLRSSSSALETHQKKRSTSKKLAVF